MLVDVDQTFRFILTVYFFYINPNTAFILTDFLEKIKTSLDGLFGVMCLMSLIFQLLLRGHTEFH